MEADLHRVYGTDLLGQMWRGEVTPRFVAVRVSQLPQGSQVWRALDHPAGWTDGDYLLARAVDHLANANWQRAGEKNAKRPEPEHRPGHATSENKVLSRAQAFIARRSEIGGAE